MEFRSNSRLYIPILVFFILSILPQILFAQRDLGIPVREPVVWGAYVGPGKEGNLDTIYLSFGQYEAPLFLLAVHPDTGQMKQFNGPLSSEMGSWGYTVDHENRIYLGSYYHAHLLRFDPKTEKWEDLGRPGGETESFICALTTTPDGKIWGGTFPSAKLFSFDPKTRVTQNYGRMDPDQFYCYPTAGRDGLIYCAIRFEKTDIVVFDPVKETGTSLIPFNERRSGWLSLTRGEDGRVYAKLPSNRWFRIEDGKNLVEVTESEIPFPKKALPDGRQFHVVDNHLLRIENPLTKEKKEIFLQYDASGSSLFVVGTGPDKKIYGSSMLPLRLFEYDPKPQSLKNLGKASKATGEVYSMGSFDGNLYLCSYPEGRLSVYDPKRPLRFGEDIDSNPRDLGSLGEGVYRPRAMIAGPHEKIYVGGYPDYGMRGGAISVYDLKRVEKRTYRHLIQNQSIASLTYVPQLDLIVAGSSVRGGTGTRAIEKEAKLILWEPKEEWKIAEILPVPGARAILSLAVTAGGIVYGITDRGKVFSFDPERVEVINIFDLGLKEPIETSLQLGPGGRLYGLAREAIFFIDPRNDEVSLMVKPPVPIHSGMGMLDRKIYFGSGANLWEFEIPNDPSMPVE
jgi:hypothetical protein